MDRVTTAKLNTDLTTLNYLEKTDDFYLFKIQTIAKNIMEHAKEKPIILLSGPSGSGKTTTAFLLEKYLDKWGMETHTISMDNYFKTMSEHDKKLSLKGKMDFESPNRIDSELFSSHIQKMINCQEVSIPKFDFINTKRVDSGVKFTRKPNELIIFEGIHALNPDVIKVDKNNTSKIYISVRKRVVSSEGVILHPKYVRLLRRMCRDKIYRGRDILETLKFFESVEVGVDKYILPYKNLADYEIDTFIDYELNVYKNILYNDLKSSDIKEIKNILNIFNELDSISEEKVPKDSLIREFIGNGQFEY